MHHLSKFLEPQTRIVLHACLDALNLPLTALIPTSSLRKNKFQTPTQVTVTYCTLVVGRLVFAGVARLLSFTLQMWKEDTRLCKGGGSKGDVHGTANGGMIFACVARLFLWLVCD